MAVQPKGYVNGVRKLSCEIIDVDKRLAGHLLKSTLFPRQRDVSQQQVDRYVSEMRHGWWIPGSPLFFAVLPNDDMFLLNGQHSLSAVVASGISQPFTATFYGCRDMDEAGHLYSRFDIHRRRSWNDAYKAAGFHEKFSLHKTWIGAFGSSIRLLLARFRPYDREFSEMLYSREMQLRIFEGYIPHANAYIDALAHTTGVRSLVWRRSGVMSVAMELFRYQPKKAAEFFRLASNDDRLPKGEGPKVLLDYLNYTNGMSWENRQLMAYTTMLCWNAFWRGDLVGQVQPGRVTDMRLLGTPWSKAGYDPFAGQFAELEKTVKPVKYEKFTTGMLFTGQGERIPVTQAAQ